VDTTTRMKSIHNEKKKKKNRTDKIQSRNSSGDEIAKRDFSVYLFILQLYKSLNSM